MRRFFSAALIVVLCICMGACSSKKEEQEKQTKTAKALAAFSSFPDTMPEFSTVDLEGNMVTNDLFSQADLTVVNFWATYCNPCIDELPKLAEWSETMSENVQLVGIVTDIGSEDSEEYAAAQQIVEKTEAGYQHLLPGNEFNDIIGQLVGVPTTFFVDKEGNIVGDPIVGADVTGYKKFVEEYFDGQE